MTLLTECVKRSRRKMHKADESRALFVLGPELAQATMPLEPNCRRPVISSNVAEAKGREGRHGPLRWSGSRREKVGPRWTDRLCRSPSGRLSERAGPKCSEDSITSNSVATNANLNHEVLRVARRNIGIHRQTRRKEGRHERRYCGGTRCHRTFLAHNAPESSVALSSKCRDEDPDSE